MTLRGTFEDYIVGRLMEKLQMAANARFVEWFADLEVTRYLLRRFAVGQLQEEGFLKAIGESKTDVFWMLDADGTAIGASASPSGSNNAIFACDAACMRARNCQESSDLPSASPRSIYSFVREVAFRISMAAMRPWPSARG